MAVWNIKPEYDKAVEMYDGGMSIGQVAHRFGVTRQSMHKVLRRRGVVFRSRLKYGQENVFYLGSSKAVGRTHDIFERAIERGTIKRPGVCQHCGKTAKYKDGRDGIHAHHPDYSKPLEIMWLCRKCHFAWHKNNVPKGVMLCA